MIHPINNNNALPTNSHLHNIHQRHHQTPHDPKNNINTLLPQPSQSSLLYPASSSSLLQAPLLSTSKLSARSKFRNTKNLSLNLPAQINSYTPPIQTALPKLPDPTEPTKTLAPSASEPLEPPMDSNKLPFIYSSIPTVKPQQPPVLSRSLSIKIPKSPTFPSPPSSITASSINNPSRSDNWNSSITNNNIVLVNQPSANFQEECMETTENAYLNGPLFICEPNIYLYSEPTREQAMEFDLVINVAREVKNPFQAYNSPCSFSDSNNSEDLFFSSLPSSPPSSLESNYDNIMSSPFLSSDASTISPVTAEPWQPLSPHYQKPLQTPVSSMPTSGIAATKKPMPEYIYVPWEHTSQLTADLASLTDLMAQRAQQGKKILVHCQCGVSRSASLIVAYVMRQNKWGLHHAYSFVKEKSPAISPNMTLIYQLMEWGKMLKLQTSQDEDEDFEDL
ncbi:similar to Saccharomyces cerevisiae YNL053W MSG5 Dual-specificity protein phosphatase [Geotrichum candidum]|uniref:protein-tyrosine-phosphatase n=1 Tax=Geotrichum candidum TaxID=1173061 RepID=A0A0J9X7E9_GEOCN|nr:similar to Saccharomyces cerevisiae YNL053W MSG5 Dual-specificity protein phosphatase [Geotrichum candidum]